MSRGPLVAALLLLSPVHLANAQEWAGADAAARFGFEESREAGSLVGCNFSFRQIVRDDISRRGAPVIVSGLLMLVKV